MPLRTEREISEAYAAQTAAMAAADEAFPEDDDETEEWAARLAWVDAELDCIPASDVTG